MLQDESLQSWVDEEDDWVDVTPEEADWIDVTPEMLAGNEPMPGDGSRWDLGVEQLKGMAGAGAEWIVNNLPDAFWELPDAVPGRKEELQTELRAFQAEADAKANLEKSRLPEDVRVNLERRFDSLDKDSAWRNPSAIWDQLVVQAPNYTVGIVPAVAAMTLGVGPAAIVGAAVSGLMTLGDATSQIRQEILDMPEEKLQKDAAAYRQYLSEGMSPDDARNQLIEDAQRWTGLGAAAFGMAVGGAGGWVGGKMMPGKSRLGRIGVGAVTQGPEEFGEEFGTQVASNIGVQQADPRRGTFDEAWNAGLMGLTLGGPSGGAAAAFTPYVATDAEKAQAKADREQAIERLRQLQEAQAAMEAAASAEAVVAAANQMVDAPLDTFELDQFHQTLTEQGLARQAEIDALGITEGPFVSTRLWKETVQGGGSFLNQVSDAQQEAFEAYDNLSKEAQQVTPEPAGFRDWKAAQAQVADQEVAESLSAEDDAVKTLSFLEREVGAILDNEEVGPEVKNTQIKDALESLKNDLQAPANTNPDDRDGGDGGGGAAAVKSAPTAPPVTLYGSGANGKADFAGQAKAGMRSGVEASRLSKPMVTEVAKSESPVFVDSGAFGAFRNGEQVDFGAVYDTYEAIDAQSDQPNMRFVAPDLIGDQDATLALQKEYAERTNKLIERGHEALVPVQKGKLQPRKVVEQVRKILGHDNFTVAVPANEAAFTENDLRDLMRARPKKVHFLGVAANQKKLDKLTRIVRAFVPDAEISADGNRIRAVTDKKFAEEAKGRKAEAAAERVQTASKYDETEEIQSFVSNPGAVPKAQLQTFLDGMPFQMTAEQAVRNPQSLAAKIEEFDPNWDAARLAYNKAVRPQAEREVAGEVRTEMVAEKLSAREKRAREAGQQPLFKRAGKPLNKIRVTMQATVAETGETVEIEQRADVALEEIDNRIGALQQLLGCVA